MKKYLYEIGERGKDGVIWCTQHYPFMPRVLAEKTARQLNKSEQRTYGRLAVKYVATKTTITTEDGTPHGFDSIGAYWNR